MFSLARLVLTGFALLLPFLSLAQETTPEMDPATLTPEQREEYQKYQQLQKLAAGLNYRSGTVVLKEGLATVQLTDKFRYLDAKDSEAVLNKMWGNPPDKNVLGVLMPTGMSPLQEDAWAVVITYDESGYVKDDEAAKIDYHQLLVDMQKATKEANEERVKEGYAGMELLGWAATPHYDAGEHKLYWAKRLKVNGAPIETLNYNIRALGRKGVLELNAVAGMNQLQDVEAATPEILKMVNFNPGFRYADFNSATDEVAKYGLTALIAGGVLAKTGLLKTLLAGVLAFKKFFIVGAMGLFALIKRLVKGKDAGNTSGPLQS